jgi:outer membrane immunogenic protein
MKTMLMSAVMAAALGSGAAMAADMPLKAPGAPIYQSWTGIYIGGSAGIAVGDMKDFCSLTFGTCAGNADDTSWVGGGHVGIQWQTGQWVFGAEGKWMATDLNPFSNCPNPAFRCSIHIDNYWTAGGRLGYALAPNSLFYVTGGYAQSKIDRDTVRKTTNTVDESWSATQPGWYIGSGAEFRLANTGWVLGAEYNHIDFRAKNATEAVTHNITTVKATVDTFQARLSYLFNWR